MRGQWHHLVTARSLRGTPSSNELTDQAAHPPLFGEPLGTPPLRSEVINVRIGFVPTTTLVELGSALDGGLVDPIPGDCVGEDIEVTHNAWKPGLQAAGLERNRENGMHALRHHYASVLLENGVSIRAVSEYLGHHDPGFTLRIYAHLMPESEDRARSAIDATLGAPAESSRNAKHI